MEGWIYFVGVALIIPAFLFSIFAQFYLQHVFKKYERIGSRYGRPAFEIARKILDENGCQNVAIGQTSGHLTDHYNPRKKTLRLNSGYYGSSSLAAIGVAAHEAGHAIQHRQKYIPLMIRRIAIGTTTIVNKLLLPLIIVGMIVSVFTADNIIAGIAGNQFWMILIIALCGTYLLSFVINLFTLPTEFNASRRAKKILKEGYLSDEDEYRAVSRCLNAAAMTYVAAMVSSLAVVLRIIVVVLRVTRNSRR